jgi:hypothetical protein
MNHALRSLHLLAAAPLLAGCVIGADKYPRPSELTPAWLVDRPRLLGVRAEPAEPRPGDVVTFEALFPDPTSTIATVIWIACPFDQAAGADAPASCNLDLSSIDFETASIEDLLAAGLIGLEPGFPPTYPVPLDLLDAVEDRTEGTYVTLQISGLPELEPGDTAVDFGEIEAGLKRLPISESETPNHNPELTSFAFDGVVLAPGSTIEVEADTEHSLSVTYADDAVEAYAYVNSDGVSESRVEEPYITWYATGGEVYDEVSLHPYAESRWIAGAPGEVGTLWAVVRDRRGGMSWLAQSYTVRDGVSGAE